MRPFVAPPPRGAPTGAGDPSFSVLVPAYQAEATVAETVESALAQTYPVHEVIVCDDGSTDGTAAALEPYRERIVYLRKENGGGASALNHAAARATGDFVVVLDSDDVYLPERLEAIAALARERPDLGLLMTDAWFEVEGERVGRFAQENGFEVDDQRRGILERCFIFAPAVRRDAVAAIGGWDEQLAIGYDWSCWMRLIFSGVPAGLVDEPLMHYRLREGSLASSRVEALRDRVRVLDRVPEQLELTDQERELFARARRVHEQRLKLADAELGLNDGAPDARTRLRAVACDDGFDAPTRAKALAAMAAPGVARRLVRRRAGQGRTRLVRTSPGPAGAARDE
ncbi:MAG: glycosyltransferase family 2 protein [Thermoleophilaceae bacterium]